MFTAHVLCPHSYMDIITVCESETVPSNKCKARAMKPSEMKNTHKWWVFCVAVCISHFPSFFISSLQYHETCSSTCLRSTRAIPHYRSHCSFPFKKSIRFLLSRVGCPKWNSTHRCCCCHFLLISRVNTNKSREERAHTPQHTLTRHLWYSGLRIWAQISNIDSSTNRMLFVLAPFW